MRSIARSYCKKCRGCGKLLGECHANVCPIYAENWTQTQVTESNCIIDVPDGYYVSPSGLTAIVIGNIRYSLIQFREEFGSESMNAFNILNEELRVNVSYSEFSEINMLIPLYESRFKLST
jgi:hypothetical protein